MDDTPIARETEAYVEIQRLKRALALCREHRQNLEGRLRELEAANATKPPMTERNGFCGPTYNPVRNEH